MKSPKPKVFLCHDDKESELAGVVERFVEDCLDVAVFRSSNLCKRIPGEDWLDRLKSELPKESKELIAGIAETCGLFEPARLDYSAFEREWRRALETIEANEWW